MGSHFSDDNRKTSMPGYQGARFKQAPASGQPAGGRPQGHSRPTGAQRPETGAQRYARTPQPQPQARQNPYGQGYAQQQPYQGGAQSRSAYTAGGYPQQTPPRRKKRWPIVVGVISAVVLAILVAGGVVGFKLLDEVKAVKDDAYAIVDSASSVKDSLSTGNGDALMAVAQDMQTRSSRMHETTSGALWNLAAMVPVIGSDVKTVQSVAASLDTLSSDVVMPIASTMQGQSISSLFAEDGGINVELLSSLANALVNSKEPVNKVAADIAGLPDAHIEQLQGALEKAKPLVASVNDAVNVAAEIAPFLPQMLGANGQTRNYVIIAQNNVEIRTTGGYPGSTGVLSITDGHIELGDFSGVGKFTDEHDVPVTDEEIAIFGPDISDTVQNITMNPDFPASGQHMRDLYAANLGTMGDGVIALDPVFLQHMLGLVGGVTLSDGVTVDGNNAAYILMHDVYVNKPVSIQDAYFAAAAGAAADQITKNLGNADITALIDVVKKDAAAGRFQIWMANPDEQAIIERLGFSGAISTDPAKPQLGVYVNDETWAKMSWYLSINTTVSEGTKNFDGTTSYQVTTTFKNNITEDEANSVPKYITGYIPLKRSVSDMVFKPYFYAPAGGSITNMQSDATFSPGGELAENTYEGLQVFRGMIQLEAQQVATFTYTVTTPAAATDPLTVRTTPTAQEAAGWQ